MHPRPSPQRGLALPVALMLLTVLTLISVFAATTGGLELRMARNLQESMDSFQAAEAGVEAVLALVRTGPDPFADGDNDAPFADLASNPLENLNDGAGSVNVNIVLLLRDAPCPRSTLGYSVDLVLCDHYRIESSHTSADARSQVNEGIAKPVIGGASL